MLLWTSEGWHFSLKRLLFGGRFCCTILESNPKTAIGAYYRNENKTTMKFLTLDYIQKHSRIDGSCEAEVLNLYGEAAEDTVLNYIGLTFDELKAKYNNTVPKPIVQAALMLVDTWYQYRSPISGQSLSIIPYTFDILVKPYMIL